MKNRSRTKRWVVSLWDTNPWSNFRDPHWELICRKKWHPGTSEISMPAEVAAEPYFMCDMALKLYWQFYLLMEKPLGRYYQVRSPYYQMSQCNQKTPISVSSRWLVRSEKAQKEYTSTLIRPTTSVHLFKPVSTDLTIIFSFNQPSRKIWSARLVNVIKHLPHKVLLLEHHH